MLGRNDLDASQTQYQRPMLARAQRAQPRLASSLRGPLKSIPTIKALIAKRLPWLDADIAPCQPRGLQAAANQLETNASAAAMRGEDAARGF